MKTMIQKGDIILVRKIRGFKFISDLLVWWQNSKVASHVGVCVDEENLQVFDARMFQKSKIVSIEKFFDGKHDIRILRYAPELTDKQKEAIVDFLECSVNVPYDNGSILSIVSNKDVEDKDRLNCAESTLLAYHNAGLLTKRSIEYILPHTFWEFYMADRFSLVTRMKEPTKKDLMELTYG